MAQLPKASPVVQIPQEDRDAGKHCGGKEVPSHHPVYFWNPCFWGAPHFRKLYVGLWDDYRSDTFLALTISFSPIIFYVFLKKNNSGTGLMGFWQHGRGLVIGRLQFHGGHCSEDLRRRHPSSRPLLVKALRFGGQVLLKYAEMLTVQRSTPY